MKRITDEEIARALEKQPMFKGMDLTFAIDAGDRLTAQAQLKSCEAQIPAIERAAMERGRKEIIKSLSGCITFRGNDIVEFELSEDDWKALKSELLGKGDKINKEGE